MKPDLKSKTLSAIKEGKPIFRVNPKYRQNMTINLHQNQIIYDDEDDNPYKVKNYNYSSKEPQFQKKNPEKMPLEMLHHIKEKKFKAHLVQRLRSFKIKQAESRKIPLNLASKKRREENFRNSLKHLLVKQCQPKDIRKELMYYRGYFRFWKKKSKIGDDQRFRRRIKKDRNIRITTVIYKAEIPARIKDLKMKKMQEQKILSEKKNEVFRRNLIVNLEKRNKNRTKNYNNENNNININYNNKNDINNINNQNYKENIYIYNNNEYLGKNIGENMNNNFKLPQKEIKTSQNISNQIINNSNIKNNSINANNVNEGFEKLNNIYAQKEEKKVIDEQKKIENISKKKEAIKRMNQV
jgi:hypothetical protein